MLNNEVLNIDLIQGYKEKLSSAILTKMITLYADQSQRYISDIESALLISANRMPATLPEVEEEHVEHYDAWKTACHKMKGAAASVGLIAVYELSKKMELMEDNKDEKVALFIRLKQKNKEGIEAFLQFNQ
jgi:HPt (histidine-containing phosphotransfer) domain-containing protein